MTENRKPVIEVQNLKKYFSTSNGMLHALDDVTFTIERGKTLGVVGESGCGKSTLGRTIIHLHEATDGKVLLNGNDVTHVKGKALKSAREKMQIIFQDPYSSLDPRKSIDSTIREPLKICGRFTKAEIEEKADELMHVVGIDERLMRSYPHELDGGRRQRVVIARALALKPEFIVCDEPVSALDVSIQAQVLNLLKELQIKNQLTYMFVTHDMSVVRHISDDICVMYLGQVVEKASTKEILDHPMHPYTQALLSAIPTIDIHHPMKRQVIKGEITSPINPKPGCRFAARCPYAKEECLRSLQQAEITPGHFVTCARIHEL